MARDLTLIIVGFGAVGQALAHKIQLSHGDVGVGGQRVRVVGIADSKSSVFSRDGLDLGKMVDLKKKEGAVGKIGSPSGFEMIGKADADVLVELASAGGQDGEPGLSRMLEALDRGMHVVSSNKMPLAVAYSSLMKKAGAEQRMLRYGACVGAGIPVLEFADACMASDQVRTIRGVLNATSNYIVTKMEVDGTSFERALHDAQTAGFAEADPSLDIKGVDAACKAVILGNHVLGRNFVLKDVKELDGIDGVSPQQIKEAKAGAKKIRMVATVDRVPRITLVELPYDDPLAVDGARNAVVFHCEISGDRYIGGEGAGGPKTSQAVFRDIRAIAASQKGGS